MAKVLVKQTDFEVRVGTKPRRFYSAITVFMIAIVLKGFWPSYFGPLLRGVAARPWVIHLHGIVFFLQSEAWLRIGRVLIRIFNI